MHSVVFAAAGQKHQPLFISVPSFVMTLKQTPLPKCESGDGEEVGLDYLHTLHQVQEKQDRSQNNQSPSSD